MAVYVITNSRDVNWDDNVKFQYRYESQDGSEVAQAEFEPRRAAGLPTVLWRWENNNPTLVEAHNA